MRSGAALGMTLLELMIVVAIGAILMTVAVPAFNDVVKTTRLKGQVSTFRQALMEARQLAVNRGQPVTICRSNDQSNCKDNNQWENGWIIFLDDDGNGARDTSSGSSETLKTVQQGLSASYSLRSTGSTTTTTEVTYQSSGAPADAGGSTFSLCGPEGDKSDGRDIGLNVAGRAQVTEGASSCP
jgi:type IV fimbrial biogenesis protein FimT